MRTLKLSKVFTLLEPGPVVLVATNDGRKNNIMTISWTMVMDFTPRFAITTGAWNHSYAALVESGECVIAVPTIDLIDQVIGVGTVSGKAVDKFEKYGLTPVAAREVRAPLIRECLVNIECRVVDIIEKYSIVVLQGIHAHIDDKRDERRIIHARGDGFFSVDGEFFDRRDAMRNKIPDNV